MASPSLDSISRETTLNTYLNNHLDYLSVTLDESSPLTISSSESHSPPTNNFLIMSNSSNSSNSDYENSSSTSSSSSPPSSSLSAAAVAAATAATSSASAAVITSTTTSSSTSNMTSANTATSNNHQKIIGGGLQNCGGGGGSGNGNGISNGGSKMFPNILFCKSHEKEILKHFCYVCLMPACKTCVETEHQAGFHTIEPLVNDVVLSQVDIMHQTVQKLRKKLLDMQNSLLTVEQISAKIQCQYNKALNEISETSEFYRNMLEERKNEIYKDLESVFSTKQMTLNVVGQRSHDTIEKTIGLIHYMEQILKCPNVVEPLMCRRYLEEQFRTIISFNVSKQLSQLGGIGQNGNSNGGNSVNGGGSGNGINPNSATSDLEFVSNYQTIQNAVRTSFGYVRSTNPNQDISPNLLTSTLQQPQQLQPQPQQVMKQPPIARPSSTTNMMIGQLTASSIALLNGNGANAVGCNGGNGIVQGGGCSNGTSGLANGNGLVQSLVHTATNGGAAAGNGSAAGSSGASSINGSSGSLNGGVGGGSTVIHSLRGSDNGLNGTVAGTNGAGGGVGNGGGNGNVCPFSNNSQSTSPFESNILTKRFNSVNSLGPFSTAAINDLNLTNGLGTFDKWSNGNVDLFQNGNIDSDSIADISSKLMSTTMFPPKSQIKRQKMIYHCKFGEFGVMEGQFTEPSGVAINAQNDIIVADTNNHRIQIFDKEGRFKFQFGECGKRDGQLLYPNRVAVVKSSGDIIVTERSPTHQIQIYNQYGQFVRKFGANILQHPRGVTVDSHGRIVVVECKVMRVIIFDQSGTVLTKFGCSKHLEFPNGVVVNDKQEIFISDNRAHCVKVFNYEGLYLRQIGGEGITNYPIGVGISSSGEILIADNHNNFNLTIFTQEGHLITALESKVKHAQCFDVALMDDGSVVLASKDYRLYIYRYIQVPPVGI